MSVWAIPHERNGSRCPVCQRPVYATADGWRDRNGHGTHREPPPRTGQP